MFRLAPEFGYLFQFSVVTAVSQVFIGVVTPDSEWAFAGLLVHPVRLVCVWRLEMNRRYCITHSHPIVEVVYHRRGAGVTKLGNGRHIRFEPHGTVLYPAGMAHDQTLASNGEDICLHLECAGAGPALGKHVQQPLYIPPLPQDPFVRSEFLHIAQVGFDQTRQLELDLRATALLVRLLNLGRSFASKAVPPDPAAMHLARARQFIRENYRRIQRVGDVADHVGVSEDYLRHLFLERNAASLNHLLTEARIERAKELLIHSRLPLKEIASLCGFRTERYLSARFKQWTSRTPGVFRRRAASAASAQNDRMTMES